MRLILLSEHQQNICIFNHMQFYGGHVTQKLYIFSLYHSTNRSRGLFQKSYKLTNQIAAFAI